jgi:hypothetical protein
MRPPMTRIAGAVMGAVLAVGSIGVVAVPPASAELVGWVSGRVTAAGTPVANAWVSLMPVTPTGDWAGQPALTTTDSDGRYEFRDLFSFHVKIQVQAPSFSGLASAYWPLAFSFASAGTLRVAPSGSTADVELPPGSRITGRVVDQRTGAPIAGARVQAHVDAPPGWESVGAMGLAASPGEFVIDAVPPVPVALQASAPGGDNHIGQWFDGVGYFGGATKVQPGASGVVIALAEGAQISGVVRDGSGDGVPAAVVTLVGCPGLCPMIGVADAQGSYQIPGIPPGPGMRAYADGRDAGLLNQWYSSPGDIGDTSFDLTGGQALTGVDFALTAGAFVTGRILDVQTGESLTGVTVDLLHVGNPLRSFGSRVGVDPDALPGSPQRFVIGPIPPGQYSVVVFPGFDNAEYLPTEWVRSSGFDGPAMLDLAQGETAEVTISLARQKPLAYSSSGPDSGWPGAREDAPRGDGAGSGQWPGLAPGFLGPRVDWQLGTTPSL